ncbi:MAG: hypothetical protein R3F50_05175 [Gammaproteobacteria bacterium]
MGKLFEELKRRKVFKVGAVYAVVAWVLIQVADTVLPALQMPSWTVSFVTVLFFLGFPIAIILAWAYEVTPAGIRPDDASQRLPAQAYSSDRKLMYATFLLVLVAVAIQLADRFVLIDETANTQTSTRRTSQGVTTRLSVDFTNEYTYRFFNGGSVDLAFSPDGSQLVFGATANDTQERMLVLRKLAQRELYPIPGTENSGNPLFSPDGESLAFFTADGQLKRTTLDGRPPVTLTDASDQFSKGLWVESFIYFTTPPARRLMKVPVEGGQPQEINIDNPDLANSIFSMAEIQATGQILLGRARTNRPHIILWEKESGQTQEILSDARLIAYVNAGYLIFVRDQTLMAARFDAESGQVGFAVPVLGDHSGGPGGNNQQIAMSESGILGYLGAQKASVATTLNWVQSDGTRTVLAELAGGGLGNVSLSPDGMVAALDHLAGEGTYLWDMSLQVPIGREIQNARTPSWHPNGNQLLFSRGFDLVRRTIEDGSEEILFSGPPVPEAAFYTPDGETVIFHARDTDSFTGIYALFAGESVPRTLLAEQETHYINPAISPNGRWLAYQSGRSIYVTRFPSLTGTRRVSTDEDSGFPHWRSDGKAVFFIASVRSNSPKMQVVEAGSADLVRFTAPQTLFAISEAGSREASLGSANSGAHYAPSSDGSRFLMIYGQNSLITDSEIVIVQNWEAELERLLPEDRF